MLFKLSFFSVADPCYDYSNLSKANRNKKETGSTEMCDNQLPEGWYRFVGGAGTKMPTKHVPAYRCGTVWSGWLDGVHPTVEDGEVYRTVCFSNRPSYKPLCKYSTRISVKNCGSYLIYRLHYPPQCDSRYCGTDWIQEIREPINWSSGTSRTSEILQSPLFMIIINSFIDFIRWWCPVKS